MKITTRLLMLILGVSLLCSTLTLPIAAESAETVDPYTQSLIDKGFPASYAEKLTELHYLHPTWEFEPLLITEMKSEYTWEFVLGQETDNPKRNLINKGSSYTPYRHATNTELYDSGWYQASYEAVSYFMDPENFLNEKDIFMFQDLRYSDAITADIVESALVGTFMSNTVLYDDVTYAAYLVEAGKQLDVDPLHLAARLRQEQGTSGNSPLIKGTCGDKLWYYYENQVQTENGKQVLAPASGHTEAELTAYNGLYNYFNIGAAGTGYFAIYLGAMKEAAKGTEEMAEAWGGSGKWDTPAKAIYGGAYKLTHKYVGDYQNTLYLQKFNVDPRSSRNFWGQYMQNVGAAVTEARTIFNSLYASDCLELPYHFLIPIYEGKPAQNPDPAQGSCDTYAAADTLVHTESKLTSPTETEPVMDGVLYVRDLTMTAGEAVTLKLHGHATLAYDALIMRVNGEVADAQTEHDNAVNPTLIGKDGPGKYPNTLSFDCSVLEAGDYTFAVYGRLANPGKGCPHHLLAVIELHVDPAPKTTTEEITTEAPNQTQTDTSSPTDDKDSGTPNDETPTYGPGAAQDGNSCTGMIGAGTVATLVLIGAALCKKKK